MFHSEVRTWSLYLITTLCCFLADVRCEFVFPKVLVQALAPVGFRVSIPDSPGIEMFSFEGEINKFLDLKDSKIIEGDALFPFENEWTYENLNYTLQLEDVLEYNVFVQHRSLGYLKEGLLYIVTRTVNDVSPLPNEYFPNFPGTTSGAGTFCHSSNTLYNGGESTCRGQLIFEETFDQLLSPDKWIVERRFPAFDQENEFVYYDESAVKITHENRLQIIPSAVNDDLVKTKLDLTKGCTATHSEFCKMENSFPEDIRPPVVSGKITTRGKFSFMYGRLEIKAKLPRGKWIYPEIYLEPQGLEYGSLAYESGLIRVAFVRGNDYIDHYGVDIGSKQLSAGIILEVSQPCRNKWVVTHDSNRTWAKDFHTFGMTWKEGSISFDVDGYEYGVVSPPATGGFRSYAKECPNFNPQALKWSNGILFAPFDKEFYLTIGVGVGGQADFPNDVLGKKWTNLHPKAKFQFYKNREDWKKIWSQNGIWKAMVVESVRVWAN